jgi:hypothetical protein
MNKYPLQSNHIFNLQKISLLKSFEKKCKRAFFNKCFNFNILKKWFINI